MRFATEIVAWVATPWALAGASPVLAGAAVLVLIGLPAVFVTPGDKVKVVVPVPGSVTIGLVALQMVAAVVSSWAAWPVPVAVLVSLLVGVTIRTELPRWRRLAGGELVIPRPLHLVNEGLAFLLEVLALAALAWWGADAGSGLLVPLLLGIGAPLAAAVVWGLFASPRPRMKLPLPGVIAVQALVLGMAAIALDGVGHPALGLAFGVIAAANTVVAILDRNAYPSLPVDPRWPSAFQRMFRPASKHSRPSVLGTHRRGPSMGVPCTDDRDPAQVVVGMIDHVLRVAATWTAWDGRPIPSEDRVYTPHKAIRRTADHLIDHLAEIEARLAGHDPLPDHWHASMITTAADLAPFTEQDLEEARSRLGRLRQIWADRLNALTPQQLDDSPGTGWTFRQIAFHLEGSVYYADAVGELGPNSTTSRSLTAR